jgi:hypothetical protein
VTHDRGQRKYTPQSDGLARELSLSEHDDALNALGVCSVEYWDDDDIYMVDLSPLHANWYCQHHCDGDWRRYYTALEACLGQFPPPGFRYPCV